MSTQHGTVAPEIAPEIVQGGKPVTPLTRNLSGRGEIYSFTKMYNVPHGFEEQKPYIVALVKLDEGPMVTAQLTDLDHAAVAIGMRVEMVTRKLREDGAEGQIIYGYKFRPLLSDSA
ncbi:MAG: Zn-ribbon domain-containing OB-fold protein [Caldilineaceae bacterium]|nr:Zn-ribbon domain-containing OB-fold protein [Caldilineaceae bacterium]